jgi:hypothetical protein
MYPHNLLFLVVFISCSAANIEKIVIEIAIYIPTQHIPIKTDIFSVESPLLSHDQTCIYTLEKTVTELYDKTISLQNLSKYVISTRGQGTFLALAPFIFCENKRWIAVHTSSMHLADFKCTYEDGRMKFALFKSESYQARVYDVSKQYDFDDEELNISKLGSVLPVDVVHI